MTLTYPTLPEWLILISIAVTAVIMYWAGYRSGRIDGHHDGFDKGTAEADQRQNEQKAALQHQLDALGRKLTAAELQHREQLDAVMQDADNRVALFASKANPFTERDAHQLGAAMRQLQIAANTYSGLGASTEASAATTVAQCLRDMAERLKASLAPAPEPARAPNGRILSAWESIDVERDPSQPAPMCM